jgi:hypothetical protein
VHASDLAKFGEVGHVMYASRNINRPISEMGREAGLSRNLSIPEQARLVIPNVLGGSRILRL